jgi:hypothetical protein
MKSISALRPVSSDARQVRTRQTLLDAMLRLLEARPFDQITIREIAGDRLRHIFPALSVKRGVIERLGI